jgi:signal transduction histidine kinase/ActR/RegA family two-component response regulator
MLKELVWPHADRLLVEQLRLVYTNIGISVIPAFLLALLLVLTLQNDSNLSALLLWCGAVIATKLYSAIDARRRLAQHIEPRQAHRLVTQQLLIHALDGAAWGALTWVALDGATTTGTVLIFAVLTGILGSSMSLLAPVWIVFMSFTLALIVGATSWLWLSGDRFYLALGVAGWLYIASLVGQARNSAMAALAAIKLRFENADLVQQAEAARGIAEQANLAKSKFLAAASHDLRQPIHAQGLFLDVLSRTRLTSYQHEVLDSARSAWLASSDMLNTLLDFSRIEAGVVQPNPQPFRLQPMLYKVENDLAPLADAKGLVYRTRDTTLTLQSDPVLLELVLRNLVSNAIRYTKVGGVLVACRLRGDAALLEVWDTGIGIAPADRQDIFREFHQLGNAERDRNKGLGLGLAIAEGLARALGPPLSLASPPGRGGVFRIAVPITRAAVATSAPAPLEPGLGNRRVLIIDDDEAVRSGMVHLLRSWNCQCQAAESIAQALALAARKVPDLVIADYRLRGSHTGAHAIAELRALLGSAVPALIVTGDTAPERLREAAASGIALLHKPVTPNHLYAALAGILGDSDAATAVPGKGLAPANGSSRVFS